ncbi:MAG: H+/Na+-translocating ferredoxin:NAD+ oxidoreductase subunit [Clostridiales bacterium]|jgi:electron transport complex protein RnfE|nr:H+/Na+-translocating ferredoxin:NAD+ oxidoreductase subunit [Clostridiales bacterium]MDN5282040.1 H+/Na+-translocating ferredoxin:NAD+ oxidoreductase subunit [Candidatus Ozemobacter sp.]
MTLMQHLLKGFWKENPIFVIALGLCPALAVSSSLVNAVGMGIAATFVLLGSNIIVSLMRKIVPKKIRIPIFIVIIATFVTIIDKLIAAFSPSLSASLGIFIPLIVVNCVILGRAESFASKNGPMDSIMDALGMGAGFTIALIMIAFFRELLGEGKLFGYAIPFFNSDPALIMIMAPGGFIVFGLLIALKRHMEAKGDAR